jgi:hypothetical protein
MQSAQRSRRLAFAAGSAVSALAALALIAGPAADQASGESCPRSLSSQTFLPWLDPAAYVLAPAGDLERAGSWALRGGAAIVAGNEPFRVGGSRDRASLRLPSASSAATAPMCVGIEHPTLRFFAKRESGSPLDGLLVKVLVADEAGHLHALPIGTPSSLGTWAPTAPLAIVVNSLALINDTMQVSFRFIPLNGSQWSIDDVYVDPYRTN